MRRLRIACVVFLPLAPLLFAVMALQTDAGATFAGSFVSRLVDREIQGALRIDSIRLGVEGLRIRGIRLSDPEGARVLDVEEVEVRVQSRALLVALSGGGPLILDEIRLLGARILLEEREEDGDLSLLRAIAPRREGEASIEREDASAGQLAVEVRRLLGERLAVVVLREGVSPTLAVRELNFDLRGSFDPAGAALSGVVNAPKGLQPHAGRIPLRLALDLALTGGFEELSLASLSLQAGASTIELEGQGDLASGSGSLDLKRLVGAPEEVAALVPSIRLASRVEGSGTIRLEGGELQGSLRLEQGGGTVEAAGSFLPSTQGWSARLRARSVSLRAVDAGLPDLSISAELEADGVGADRIDGALRGARVALGAATIGPLSAKGSLRGGEVEVQQLEALLPGATLRGGGRIQVDRRRASLRFDLDAGDLAALQAAGVRLAGALGQKALELPPLQGSLLASGSFDGPIDRPAVDAKLRSDSLGWGENSIRGASLEARIATDADRIVGHFEGTIDRIATPGVTLEGLRADLSLARGEAAGAVEVGSPIGAIRGLLAAEVSNDLSELRFRRLALGWPGNTWSLREPAVVALAPTLRIEPMIFDGEDGAVVAGSASLDEAGAVEARVKGESLRLARLLPGLDEADAGQLGSVGAVNPGGPVGSVASVSSVGSMGPVGSVSPIDSESSEGPTGAKDSAGAVDFELVLRNREVAVDARLAALEASALGRLAGLERPLGGRIDGTVHASGTWPTLEALLVVDGSKLSGAGIEGVDLRLSAGWPGGLALDASRGEEGLALRLESLPPLAGLLTDPAGELNRAVEAPLVAEASLRGVDLESLPIDLLAGTRGQIDLRLVSTGSIRAPSGSLRLDVRDLRQGELGPLEGTVELEVGAETIVASLISSIQGERFLAGALRVEGAGEGKGLRATLGIEDARGGRADLEATLPIQWSALTELASPPGASTARVGGGPVELDWTLVARDLHLEVLQPFLPEVHRLEGLLDGDLAGGGSFAAPTVEGSLALREGKLGYIGLGELRDLALELELAEDRMILHRLEARSSGLLRASGEAIRQGRGSPYEVRLDLESRGFGVVSGDLVRAFLDADASFEGSFDEGALEGRLELISTTVELPDTPAKKIQDLGQHPDFRIGIDADEPADDEDLHVVSAAATSTPSTDPLRASVAVVTRAPITLRGADVTVRAKTDLLLLYQGGSMSLRGNIDTVDGGASVMGRRFVLERGRLSYTGAEALANPRLDVVALHDSPHAKVTITVGGSAQNLLTELRSDPPMSEAEIATLLATGKPQAERGTGGVREASGAASALGTVVSNQLKRNLAPKLPVDLISYQAGEDGLGTGSLEAGSYVTDRIFVEYSRNFGIAEDDRRNTNQIRVEYQLSRRWTLEVTYGDKGAGASSVFWTRTFP